MDRITIADLEAAINRARAAQPARGVEHALSSDVALLGGLYGRMIFERATELPVDALSDAEQVALLNWLPV